MPRMIQTMLQQTLLDERVIRRRGRKAAAPAPRRASRLRQRSLQLFEPAGDEPSPAGDVGSDASGGHDPHAESATAPASAPVPAPAPSLVAHAPASPGATVSAAISTLDPLDLVASLAASGRFGTASVRCLTLDAPLGDALVGAGDRLLLSERPPSEGELALVEASDGTRRLRRFYRDGDTLLLQPEDHSLPTERCSADEIAFVGTVITIARGRGRAAPSAEHAVA